MVYTNCTPFLFVVICCTVRLDIGQRAQCLMFLIVRFLLYLVFADSK